MPSLSFYDYAFLLTETADSPKHVAGLQIFRPPAGYAGDFVSDLVAALRGRAPGPPFNLRVQNSLIGLPRWVDDEHFDLSYHLRQSRLPKPGTRRQLMDLVARLHSILLDRQRPLWEVHVIEGLDDGCFALYSKIHHSYCDGATLVKIMLGTLNRAPDDRALRAGWEPLHRAVYPDAARGLAPVIGRTVGTVRASVTTALELSGMAGRMAMQRLGIESGRLPVPFTAPRTRLNTTVTRARRAAIGELPLDEVIRFAKQTQTTVNDVVVTICDIALTRYLRERDDVPDGPLVAQMPVSLRRDGNEEMGNQIAILPLTLGRTGQDPLRRLREISRSAAEVKEEALALSPDTVSVYTLMIQGLAQAGELLGINDTMPPQGNILISNVPGPKYPLYLWGAELISSYPLSAIPPGMSMNITVFSYRDKLDVGLIAGYDAIPDVEVLPGYMGEAFEALKSAAARHEKRSRKSSPRRRRKTHAKKAARTQPSAGGTKAGSARGNANGEPRSRKASSGARTRAAGKHAQEVESGHRADAPQKAEATAPRST
jgi:WS/DGAT/MGAT family acyltransferase